MRVLERSRRLGPKRPGSAGRGHGTTGPSVPYRASENIHDRALERILELSVGDERVGSSWGTQRLAATSVLTQSRYPITPPIGAGPTRPLPPVRAARDRQWCPVCARWIKARTAMNKPTRIRIVVNRIRRCRSVQSNTSSDRRDAHAGET